MADTGELRLALQQPGVTARESAGADIADMHHEGQRLRVDLVDHALQALRFELGIRRVAQHAERGLGRTRHLRVRAAAEQDEQR